MLRSNLDIALLLPCRRRPAMWVTWSIWSLHVDCESSGQNRLHGAHSAVLRHQKLFGALQPFCQAIVGSGFQSASWTTLEVVVCYWLSCSGVCPTCAT